MVSQEKYMRMKMKVEDPVCGAWGKKKTQEKTGGERESLKCQDQLTIRSHFKSCEVTKGNLTVSSKPRDMAQTKPGSREALRGSGPEKGT